MMRNVSAKVITSCLAALIFLAAFIFIEVSFQTAQGWFDSYMHPWIIGLSILGIALLICVALLTFLGVGSGSSMMTLAKTIAVAGACTCAGLIFGMTLGAIATEFAYTFLSNFNQGTAKEAFMPTACKQAIVGMILSVISIIAAAISNAFDAKQ